MWKLRLKYDREWKQSPSTYKALSLYFYFANRVIILDEFDLSHHKDLLMCRILYKPKVN